MSILALLLAVFAVFQEARGRKMNAELWKDHYKDFHDVDVTK